MGRFFDVMENIRARGRWQLGCAIDEQGEEIHSWQFIEGKFLNLGCVPTYSIVTPGNPPDFGWDIDAVPVVSTRFVQLFEKLSTQSVQFIPVRVEGHGPAVGKTFRATISHPARQGAWRGNGLPCPSYLVPATPGEDGAFP